MRDEVLTALKDYLDADVKADKWDEPPILSLILKGPSDMLMFEPMPVGPVWDRGPVHHVLHVVANVTRRTVERGWQYTAVTERIIGVALFSEGWAVSASVKEGEYADIQKYMEAGGRLADHPAGIEVKTVNAVLTDGSMLMLTHFRNGETISPSEEEDGTHEVAGRIPDGLQEVLAAFTTPR